MTTTAPFPGCAPYCESGHGCIGCPAADALTMREAADALGVSRQRVQYLVARGRLDAVKVGNGRTGMMLVKRASVVGHTGAAR